MSHPHRRLVYASWLRVGLPWGLRKLFNSRGIFGVKSLGYTYTEVSFTVSGHWVGFLGTKYNFLIPGALSPKLAAILDFRIIAIFFVIFTRINVVPLFLGNYDY